MKIAKPALLAFTCALFLMISNQQTRGLIEENHHHFEMQLLREMVGDGTEIEEDDRGYRILRNGKLTGRIHPAVTERGYNGEIRFLIAVSSEAEVISIRVLEHRETPGLGDKIDHTVSDWPEQFRGRSLDNTNWSLSPEGDIDGMTGATITTRATIDAITGVLGE